MVEWIGSRQVGLSKYQTAGEVSGSYVIRPSGSDISTVYKPGVGSTSIMIEGGATAGRGGAGVGATTTVRRDPYGNIIGVRQVGPTGQTIFERRTTLGGGAVEEGLPFGVQPRYAEIERTRAEMPLYRRRAEYRAREETKRQQALITPTAATPTFRLPIFSGYRYGLPTRTFTVLEGRTAQEYYKTYPFIPKAGTPRISEPLQSFGKDIFGRKQGEPLAGKYYRKDWFGGYTEVGKPTKMRTVSTKEYEAIRQADIYAPMFVPFGAFSSTSVLKGAALNIKPINLKKISTKMFGSETFARQKKVFGGQRYYVEPTPEAQPKKLPVLNRMFGGTAKPSPKVDVLKNMFGTSAYRKPRKTTVMDILLVQPQRQRQIQIQRPAESMWRQVIARPSEVKPMTSFESTYAQQYGQRLSQYTEGFTRLRPTTQLTPVKPTTTRSVFEQINLQYQYRISPQARKPILRTIPKTQYRFMSGWANALGSMSGLMQGQRQEQRFGQMFQQQQAQRQGFKQRFGFDYTFKIPVPTKIDIPTSKITEISTTKYPPSRLPPKEPPKEPTKPPREPPMFRAPPKPIKITWPAFEMPSTIGIVKRRKQKIKEKVIVTRMLSLKDIFGR